MPTRHTYERGWRSSAASCASTRTTPKRKSELGTLGIDALGWPAHVPGAAVNKANRGPGCTAGEMAVWASGNKGHACCQASMCAGTARHVQDVWCAKSLGRRASRQQPTRRGGACARGRGMCVRVRGAGLGLLLLRIGGIKKHRRVGFGCGAGPRERGRRKDQAFG